MNEELNETKTATGQTSALTEMLGGHELDDFPENTAYI
jgi:hypothetical protein